MEEEEEARRACVLRGALASYMRADIFARANRPDVPRGRGRAVRQREESPCGEAAGSPRHVRRSKKRRGITRTAAFGKSSSIRRFRRVSTRQKSCTQSRGGGLIRQRVALPDAGGKRKSECDQWPASALVKMMLHLTGGTSPITRADLSPTSMTSLRLCVKSCVSRGSPRRVESAKRPVENWRTGRAGGILRG